MPVIERGQKFEVAEKVGEGYTVVIELSGGRFAIDPDQTKLHIFVAEEAEFCQRRQMCPPVFDGVRLVYTHRSGWLISSDVTSTTSPDSLKDLERGSPEYNVAFVAMRSVSAQMLANSTGVTITAEYPNDTSEKFSPQQ